MTRIIFGIYLGFVCFRPENQSFLWKKQPHTQNHRQGTHSNQIYLVTLTYGQLTQASFLQKNQMLQNGFLIFLTLR